ncbi:hypothetical protein ACIQ6Y_35050 [Streptomyces sp. NPDC096205]|uniref:hypothetical protein n=1 Tax=Streptomyces sp. NPDC096205 TaxID=3366081 RepID=UPI00382E2246
MDRTVTTGRLVLAGEGRRQRYGEPDGSAPPHPPIYAALIREWQSGGRTVPGVRDAQWTALVSPAPLIGESPPRRTAGPPDGG